MKKLIIAFIIFLSTIGNSIANDYSLLEPPAEVKYESSQAHYFYNLASGCTYLYMLQNKHANFSQLLDGGQPSSEWAINTAEGANYWVKRAIIVEDLLVKDFNIKPEQIVNYKQTQITNLNQFFMENFMEVDIREYFTRILGSTAFCVAGLDAMEEFLKLAESNMNQNSVPQSDKPKRKM